MNFKLNHIKSFQIFQFLKYGSSLLISISLAKSYLTVADLGKFESFIFYSSSISFFWISGISQALLSAYPAIKNIEKNTFFFSASILFFILSILSCTIFFIPSSLNQIKIFESFTSEEFNLFLIFLVINPIGFLPEFILLLKKSYQTLISFGFITMLIPFLLVSTPVIFDLQLIWCFYGLILWACIKFAYLIFLILKYSKFKIIRSEILELLKLSSPLIITALLAGSASYIDSLIISLNFTPNTFAIFRYGAREFPVFLLIANAFGTSMIPMLAKKELLQKNLQEIKMKSKSLMHIFFPVAIFLLIISQYLFTHIFSKNLLESHQVFDIYLLLIISRFVFPQTILIGLKYNTQIMLISLIELIVNISASLILLRYFGYLGVAYGTIIAYFFEKILLMVILKNKIRIPASKYVPLKELMFYSFILLSAYIFKQYY